MKWLLALAATTMLCFAAPAQAIVPSDAQSLNIAYHYWAGEYCDGSTPERAVQITYDNALENQNLYGLATGVTLHDDGTYVLAACTISLQPGMEPALKCRVIVHEVGHLGGHRHEEGGIMAAATTLYEEFPLCDATTREQVMIDIRKMLPGGYRWTVHCTPALTRCRATSPRARHPRRFEISDDQITQL